ncbi:phage tail assembly chaperone [Pseudomonas sp. PDM07]|uniref:phage tail assembly chaperone n=1 Tax=Pseudomonas sp. PDM07 TaxID=2769264 RepID=UPI001785D539|nr:phage tail assembly chaperone [Pseudomonas sp. PDM07]MBD9616773.1 phage tail assembly chaperone [Pseudomonas sp. PDM07]
MNIYLFDPLGILTGPFELSEFPEVPGFGQYLPGNTVQLEKPLSPPEAGHVWALVEGKPQQLADYRGTVYRTDTGAEEEHFEIGDLPEGLTAKRRPGQFYVWSGGDWALDAAAQIAAAQACERAWRNAQVAATDYLVMPDYPITAEQRTELYAYRQALRDWPDVTLFPDQSGRPQPPAWIASLAQ